MSCTELFLDCKVESMCRACLSAAGELESLHEANKAELFCECTSLKVFKMDGLSPYLCRSCHVKLQEFYNFRQLCHQSDVIIRNRLSDLNRQNKPYLIEYDRSESIVKAEPELEEKVIFTSNNTLGNYCESEKGEKQNQLNEILECDEANDFNDYSENAYVHNDRFSIKEENKLVNFILLICDICNESFKSKSKLEKHMQKHNDTKLDSGKKNVDIKSSDENKKSNKVRDIFSEDKKSEPNSQNCFKCDICPKVFKTDGLPYQKHLKTHSNDEKKNPTINACQLNDIDVKPNNKRSYKQSQMQRMKRRVSKKRYPLGCQKCDRRFADKQLFKDHLRSHKGLPAMTFPCTICKKELKYISLAAHMNRHNTEKKYDCSKCEESFLSYVSLQQHNRIHLEPVKYVCDICGHESTQMSYFKNHLIKHTGEKRFPCDICDKRFKFASECYEHKMRHKGIKRFHCSLCPKTFWVKQSLNTHLRTHSDAKPYSCDICGKAYKSRGFCVVHRRSHTGERPFECDRCSMQFTRKAYLIRHYRTHTGEKPNKCTICSKTFIEKTQLNRHTRKHHRDVTPAVQ